MTAAPATARGRGSASVKFATHGIASRVASPQGLRAGRCAGEYPANLETKSKTGPDDGIKPSRCYSFFSHAFFHPAGVRHKGPHAVRRPAGVADDVALRRRPGSGVASVGRKRAEAGRERALRPRQPATAPTGARTRREPFRAGLRGWRGPCPSRGGAGRLPSRPPSAPQPRGQRQRGGTAPRPGTPGRCSGACGLLHVPQSEALIAIGQRLPFARHAVVVVAVVHVHGGWTQSTLSVLHFVVTSFPSATQTSSPRSPVASSHQQGRQKGLMQISSPQGTPVMRPSHTP